MLKQIRDLGTEKTIPDNTDILAIQQIDGTTRHITKANLLAGISSSIQTNEYFNKTTFLAHFNGANNSTSITDVKGSLITRYGDAKISTAQSKFNNGSLFLDGTGDYLSFPYSSNFDICGGDDFKLEFWYYPLSISGTKNIFSQWKQVSGSGGFIIQSSAANLLFYLGSFSENVVLLSGNDLIINAWNHVAITRIGNKFSLWLNGVAKATAIHNAIRTLNNVNYAIGNYYDSNGVFKAPSSADPYGYMNDLRISKPTPYAVIVPSTTFPDI